MTTSNEVIHSLMTRLSDRGLIQPFTTGAYRENALLPAPTLEALPSTPDTAVSFSITSQDDRVDPYNPDIDVRLRFRAGGKDVHTVNDLADRVRAFLHTAEPTADRQFWPGGIVVLHSFRIAKGTAAQDSNGRWMRPDTYRITPHTGSGD